MAGHDSSGKAILYAFLANLGIAIAKGVAAAITGSGSMLAEAIHSLADCTNQILLFVGIKRSQKPPDAEHPLGYGKATFFWSFIVAIMLFTMGGLFSVYHGYHRIHEVTHPEAGAVVGLESPLVAIGVLVISILLEAGSLFGALKEIKLIRGNKTTRQWLGSTRNAELVVVFGEDIAALMGLVVALVFLMLAWLLDMPIFDGFGSIAIGIMLLGISFFLVTRVHKLLIGRSADPELVAHIEEFINADKSITRVFGTITTQLGPDVMLAAKVGIDPKMTIGQACEAINKLERSLKEKFPEVKWSFIEPDTAD